MIPKEHPSWKITDSTKLIAYITCPRKYFYEYILGWRTNAPNNHLVFGSAWHLAMEHLILYGYTVQTIQDAYDLFLKEYRKDFPPESDEIFYPKTPMNAFIVLGKYAANYKREDSLFEPKHTEIAGCINVSEDRVFYYRMDSVLKRKSNGKKSSREHKTGSSTWLWEDQWPLSIQVGCYNHVLYCLYPFNEVEGVTMNGAIFIRNGSKKAWAQMIEGKSLSYRQPFEFIRYQIKRAPDQMNNWLWTVNRYLTEMEYDMVNLDDSKEEDKILTAFPMRPTSCYNYGKMCDYKDFCNAWSNPLRRCHDAPIGFKIEFWDPMAKEAKQIFNVDSYK